MSTRSRASLVKVKEPIQEGSKYAALQKYIEEKVPFSFVTWTPGVQDDPKYGVKAIPGCEYQVHVAHENSHIVRGGRSLQTANGSTIEDAAARLLAFLKRSESTAMEELEKYIKNERYAEKGFVIIVENASDKSRNTADAVVASVRLSSEFCQQSGRKVFVLGTESGGTRGIAARRVLDLLRFKKEMGFTRVDENLVQEANFRYKCELQFDKLVAKQKIGETLNARDLHQLELLKSKTDEPRLVWLGREFQGPASYFKADLPEHSRKLHKILKDHNFTLETNDDKLSKSSFSGRRRELVQLVAYEAVEEYERIRKDKAQRKSEAREKSKTSSLFRRLQNTYKVTEKNSKA